MKRFKSKDGVGDHAGADKAIDAQGFVKELRATGVTPHAAEIKSGWRSAIDGRTIRHTGYAVSQRIEEALG